MADLQKAAGLLSTAAGLALELWTATQARNRPAGNRWPAELEGLHKRAQELAKTNTGLALAMAEEELSLSLALGLRSLMERRRLTRGTLLHNTDLQPDELEDILEGINTAELPLRRILTLAQALDATLQISVIPRERPGRTQLDLTRLLEQAQAQLPPAPTP